MTTWDKASSEDLGVCEDDRLPTAVCEDCGITASCAAFRLDSKREGEYNYECPVKGCKSSDVTVYWPNYLENLMEGER